MSERDTISRVRAEVLTAFNNEDLERMAAFMADDNVAMAPNQPALRTKDAVIQFWREGFAVARTRFEVTPEELAIVGDVAIDQFHWTTDSTPRGGGSAMHDEGNCIWIWRRQEDGSWKVARSIWNSALATAGLWSGAGAAR
jgi:uncharacterized protein (TIGR02246 family)